MVRGLAFVAAGVAALVAPTFASAYHWPVKPFGRQHPVRGAFDDPRFGRFFHFGIDISVRDGTPVYAVAPGTVFRYSDAVAVRRPGGREFSYWHVRAIVQEHAYVKADQEIGVVRPGFGHVHFAESDGRTYVNPLRPGGIAPFRDPTPPIVGAIDVSLTGGKVSATVEAWDVPPLLPPPPWLNAIWTPETVQWRLLQGGRAVVPWTVAADFHRFQPASRYRSIYAPATRQNRPERPGRYVFWLTRGVAVVEGSYAIQVRASDTRGNTGFGAFEFDITGDQGLKTMKLSSR